MYINGTPVYGLGKCVSCMTFMALFVCVCAYVSEYDVACACTCALVLRGTGWLCKHKQQRAVLTCMYGCVYVCMCIKEHVYIHVTL